jgi:hypothetical protein
MSTKAEISQAVAKLYPTLSPEELKKAEATLVRYFEIVAEIQEEEDAKKHTMEDRARQQ